MGARCMRALLVRPDEADGCLIYVELYVGISSLAIMLLVKNTPIQGSSSISKEWGEMHNIEDLLHSIPCLFDDDQAREFYLLLTLSMH